MSADIIDGKAIAEQLRGDIAKIVTTTKANHDFTPGLAVVLVGEDPASQVYVRNKHKSTIEAGMNSFEHKLPADTAEEDVIALVRDLNADDAVDGILVQLPLPKHIDANKVINEIHPNKDVDGLTEANAGRLMLGKQGLVPCTPKGSVMLAKNVLGNLSGKNAVVIGRSILVGKPLAMLLLAENCTVTMAHSRTANIENVVREADIVCAAVGVPEMVKGDWIKQGAVVIDVGINRIDASENGTILTKSGKPKSKLVGDVDFAASQHAAAITPVPGGVGPMTIACLLRNTVLAAYMLRGLDAPGI